MKRFDFKCCLKSKSQYLNRSTSVLSNFSSSNRPPMHLWCILLPAVQSIWSNNLYKWCNQNNVGPVTPSLLFSSASFVYGLTLAWGAEESKLALGDPIQLPQTVYRLSMWLYPNWKRQKSIRRGICVLKKAEASWLNLFMSDFERQLSQSSTRLWHFS